MVWFVVDDGLSTSPKVLGIPRAQRLAAMGLWTLAGSWCGKHLTDGAVPAFMIEEWGANAEIAAVLVGAGLWRETSKGYQFHDWKAYQQSRAFVEEKREREREKKKRWRDKATANERETPDQSPSGPESVPEGVHGGQAVDSPRESRGKDRLPTLPFLALPYPSLPNQLRALHRLAATNSSRSSTRRIRGRSARPQRRRSSRCWRRRPIRS